MWGKSTGLRLKRPSLFHGFTTDSWCDPGQVSASSPVPVLPCVPGDLVLSIATPRSWGGASPPQILGCHPLQESLSFHLKNTLASWLPRMGKHDPQRLRSQNENKSPIIFLIGKVFAAWQGDLSKSPHLIMPLTPTGSIQIIVCASYLDCRLLRTEAF